MHPTKFIFALICLLATTLAACTSTPQPTQAATPTSTPAAISPTPTASTTPQPTTTATAAIKPSPTPSPVSAPPTVSTPTSLRPVTIHLAGDSTVSNYAATTTQEGWGMELAQFFNDQVIVNNQAVGGANIQSFKGSGAWTKIISALKPGDYVLMQFGANDSGTAHGPVTPTDYAATLGLMADEVRAKGATPLFVTPSAFYDWTAGKQNNLRLAPYAAACYAAGTAKNALVVDLNARGVEWLNATGQTTAAAFYFPSRTGAPDKAHFVKAGATQMAKLVAEEIARIKSPLAAYLK